MSKNIELTEAKQEFLDHFSPIEVPAIKRGLKQVFQAAAFDTDITNDKGGKDSLFTLYQIIELVEQIEIENNTKN